MIAIFCGKLLEGGRPTVFGDGKQTRDYIYVSDVVDAASDVAANDVHGSYNVGRGVETTVLELVETLGGSRRRTKFEPEFAPGAARRGAAQRARPEQVEERARVRGEGRRERRPAHDARELPRRSSAKAA